MIEQLAIAVLGVSACFLSQDHRHDCRKWAPFLGLAAFPFWMYATVRAGQWGIVFLNFVYAGAWARGVYTYWVRK